VTGARRPTPPPGHLRQPSAWRRRLPAVALAIVGLLIAGYLALFQLGVVPDVAEPFFGDGSRRVLTSAISRLLPLPDAALGALAYLGEIVLGLIGGPRRWRTMPGIALLFGVMVVLTGATAVLLVALQIVVVRAFCTLCLVSAAISLTIVPLSLEEPLAALRVVRDARARGHGTWRVLWRGLEGD